MADHYENKRGSGSRSRASGSRTSGSRSSAGRSSGSAGSGSSYPNSSYYRRKKRKDRERRTKFLVGGAVLLLFIFMAVFAVRHVLKGTGSGKPSNGETVAESMTEPETELKKAVTINDIDITGMSRSEARETLEKKFSWGMKAQLENPDEEDADPVILTDFFALRLENILTEIYEDGSERDSYEVNAEGIEDAIDSEAAVLASRWNREAKNGAVSSFDKDSNSFVYTDSVDGRAIDVETFKTAVQTAMKERSYDTLIKVPASAVQAELTAEKAKALYKVIGTFTTKTTANADRNNNIKLACQAIDGKILQVGEEFSFNHTTGNRTEARGYKPAGAYRDGLVVLEPGGGVCQVSSTLYNAVIKAGIVPVERHAHTFEPSYVTPGEDATVSYDGYAGPDMRFVNTSSSAIAIRANYYDQTVTISLVGIPILEEGVSISLKSSKIESFDNAAVSYVEDQTLQPGEEKLLTGGDMGSRWETRMITKKDGEVISDVFYHNSTYKGHAKTIARNTSGVVIEGTTEALTIVENTETIAEQAGDTSIEGGPGAVIGGPGVIAPGNGGPAQTSQTQTQQTSSAQPSAVSPVQQTSAASSPDAPLQQTTAAQPAPVPQTPSAQPAPAAPIQQTTAAPAAPAGPQAPAPAENQNSGGPGSNMETVEAFPGPSGRE